MVEAITPEAGFIRTPDISLRQMPPARMTNVRGQGEDAGFARICSGVIGLSLPIMPNRFVKGDERYGLWQGPDEWLLIDTSGEGGDLPDRLDAALADFHHAVTDVSGNRTTLRLSGDRAVELLSAGCSLDFCSGLAAEGMVAQTILARTSVTIMRIDDAPTFDLLVRRSLVPYVREWLVTAAKSMASHLAYE